STVVGPLTSSFLFRPPGSQPGLPLTPGERRPYPHTSSFHSFVHTKLQGECGQLGTEWTAVASKNQAVSSLRAGSS
ncbi:unnamed protein product, partial [Gulo gulo]